MKKYGALKEVAESRRCSYVGMKGEGSEDGTNGAAERMPYREND